MGVSHKKVRQLIAQKKKTITDRQFFVSRILAGHFADMAVAQTKRYGYSRRIKLRIVWEPKNPNIAATENEYIWINAGHPFVTKRRGRQERYDIVCGLFTHELGHILYTDFLSGQTQLNKFEAGYWYPEKPLLRNSDERRHEADMWDYVKKDQKYMNAMMSVFHQIRNVLEDGYVESKMLSRYPGVLGYSLSAMREAQFEETPTLTQMIEKETSNGHIWLSIQNLMLSYALWGELKYGDEPLSDERVQLIFSLIGEIDNALSNPSGKERLVSANTVIIRCWPYIKDFLDICEQQAQSATSSGTATSASDIVSQLLSALAGSSKEATGGTSPVQEQPGSKNQPSAASKRAATAKQATESANAEGSAGAGESNEPEEPAEAVAEAESGDEPPAADPLGDMSSGNGKKEQQPAQEVSKEETGRIPLTQTDRLYDPIGGATEHDDDYAGAGYERAAKDIERILEQVAETAVHTELESTRTAELNELANGISYGDIHSGVPKTIRRITNVSEDLIDQYKEAAPPLLFISKQLQRSITQQLRDKRLGGKQTGLLIGRRLDVHALPRNDGHVFYKNALPSDAPQLSVGLVLDESGSMGSMDRATYARAAAIILYDFCKALRIPVMIYGHSTSGSEVDLFSYVEFDAIDRNDAYRLMDISSRGSNRDGLALRYVAEQLSRRTEDVRILILISDGQPAHSGYYGTAAEEDLRGIRQEYKRKGILFIAASIGDDREPLQRIYGDSYMDITDLSRLPVQLTEVVKRHIRL